MVVTVHKIMVANIICTMQASKVNILALTLNLAMLLPIKALLGTRASSSSPRLASPTIVVLHKTSLSFCFLHLTMNNIRVTVISPVTSAAMIVSRENVESGSVSHPPTVYAETNGLQQHFCASQVHHKDPRCLYFLTHSSALQ